MNRLSYAANLEVPLLIPSLVPSWFLSRKWRGSKLGEAISFRWIRDERCKDPSRLGDEKVSTAKNCGELELKILVEYIAIWTRWFASSICICNAGRTWLPSNLSTDLEEKKINVFTPISVSDYAPPHRQDPKREEERPERGATGGERSSEGKGFQQDGGDHPDQSSGQGGKGSGGDDSQPGERPRKQGGKKTGMACENCRKRKVKCGGERPVCSTCTLKSRELTCRWEGTDPRRRGPGKKTRIRQESVGTSSGANPIHQATAVLNQEGHGSFGSSIMSLPGPPVPQYPRVPNVMIGPGMGLQFRPEERISLPPLRFDERFASSSQLPLRQEVLHPPLLQHYSSQFFAREASTLAEQFLPSVSSAYPGRTYREPYQPRTTAEEREEEDEEEGSRPDRARAKRRSDWDPTGEGASSHRQYRRYGD